MRSKVKNSNYYKEKFIKKANNTHNNIYDYKNVKYENSIIKVEVICKEHGSFFVRPDAHVRKVGCPSCNGGTKYTKDIFVKKAKEKHGFYTYEKVDYNNSAKKVIITCPIHGEFKMSPRNHISGQKCPSCSGVKKKTKKDFIKESLLAHGDKYSYELVEYENNRNKVKIICDKHGIFKQSPKDHIRGHGCIKCSNFSKGEESIKNILDNIGLNYIRQHRFEDCLSVSGVKLPFDFYLPDLNLLIEYDGRQHFEPVELFGGENAFNILKKNDRIRNEWCSINNKKLLRISYKESLDKLINGLK